MPVTTDFERKYRFAPDPWGAEESARERYYQALLQFIETALGKTVTRGLDLGCGEGFFTSRLTPFCDELHGVDLSPTAIRRAQERSTGIAFHTCDLRELSELAFEEASFDLISICQVLFYFGWLECERILGETEKLLAPDGILVLATNCSGGDYPTPAEHRALAASMFDIVAEQVFEHHLFLALSRRSYEVALTIDYEVYEHAPYLPDKFDSAIWKNQVLDPCEELMEICEEFGAKLTLMVDVSELWFLQEQDPECFHMIGKQLKEAIRRGHDAQVHVHPRWLPELGATVDPSTGEIQVSTTYNRIHDLSDEQIIQILRKAKKLLEDLLTPLRSQYRAVAFRARKYQIQPHRRVFAALAKTDYLADTSAWCGGFLLRDEEDEPGYDFRALWHPHRPYWPSAEDICTPARDPTTVPPVLELPILAQEGILCCPDAQSADAMLAMWNALRVGGGPRIIIGHTKQVTSKVCSNLRTFLAALSGMHLVNFARLQDIVETWHERCRENVTAKAAYEYTGRSIPKPEEMWAKLPRPNQETVGFVAGAIMELAKRQDSVRVLDVGCGTGELLTIPLRSQLSECKEIELLGIDVDAPSIARAQETVGFHQLPGIRFETKTIEETEGTFDYVICSEVLEYLQDPEEFLCKLAECLNEDGAIVLAIPNGFGYGAIESRCLTRAFKIAQGLPTVIRTRLRSLYRFARNIARRPKNRVSSKDGPRRLYGTLALAESTPRHFLSFGRISRMVKAAGLRIGEVKSVELLGGVLGARAERLLRLNKLLWFTPKRLTAKWVLLCHTRNTEDE